MVQFPRTSQPRHPANRSYERDAEDPLDSIKKDLYTRWHKNTVQRDLMDQGLYVATDTGQPVADYGSPDPSAWAGVELPRPTDDATQLRADLAEWGYCLVAEALSPVQLDALRTRSDQQLEGERAAGLTKARFPQQQGISCAVNKGEAFQHCITLDERGVQKGALIEQLLTELLGPGWLINNLVLNAAGKNLPPQALHCGQSFIPKPWPPWPFEMFYGFMLDDFNAETGGTLLIPGSHRILTEAGEGRPPPLPPTFNATAPAGTAMLMDGRLAHGTGVNRSDHPRRLIITTAHKSFIRTQDTFGVSLRKDVYESAPPKLLERLGFSIEPNTGLNGTEATGLGALHSCELHNNRPISD